MRLGIGLSLTNVRVAAGSSSAPALTFLDWEEDSPGSETVQNSDAFSHDITMPAGDVVIFATFIPRFSGTIDTIQVDSSSTGLTEIARDEVSGTRTVAFRFDNPSAGTKTVTLSVTGDGYDRSIGAFQVENATTFTGGETLPVTASAGESVIVVTQSVNSGAKVPDGSPTEVVNDDIRNSEYTWAGHADGPITLSDPGFTGAFSLVTVVVA